MRIFALVGLIVVCLAIGVKEYDLLDKLNFNLFGHEMEPRLTSPNDDFEREYSLINNEQEADWGTFNFGAIATVQNVSQDANGVDQIGISDTTPMKDMEANATVDSTISPFPNGVEISILPGVQSDGKALASFVFVPKAKGDLLAPRDFYQSSHTLKYSFNEKGKYMKSGQSNVSVMQVPMMSEAFVKDTSGVAVKASEVPAIAKDIQQILKELNNLAANKSTKGSAYEKLLLNKEKTGVSDKFANLNRMINTGTYAEHYKAGLVIALGKDYLPGVAIKTKSAKDVYQQFDHIYKHLQSDSLTSKYYGKPLTKWAKTNADAIMATLVLNYQLQAKSYGDAGSYSTPISMNKSKESSLPFGKDLKTARNLKEPFYLYTTIVKSGDAKGSKISKITLPDDAVVPDLAYIFGLFQAIHLEVWVGSDSYFQNRWKKSINYMNKELSNNKVKGKNLPKDANKVSTSWSEYENNNLVKGLASSKSSKAGTSAVYKNQRIVGALRAILPKGTASLNSGKVGLYKQEIKITTLTNKTYLKGGKSSYLYSSFKSASGSVANKWGAAVKAADKTPLAPAIFKSYWGGQSFYVMMPTMLGGTSFPKSVARLADGIMTIGGGAGNSAGAKDKLQEMTDSGFKSMSFANYYVIASNLKPSEVKSDKRVGVFQVAAGSSIGTRRDATKSIALAGYVGGESFNIADYAKASGNLQTGKAKNGIKIKNAEGKQVELDHFGMFENFFTIRSEGDFVGSGTGKVTYSKSFKQEDVIKRYEKLKDKPHVKASSPNYSDFFGKAATIGEAAKKDEDKKEEDK